MRIVWIGMSDEGSCVQHWAKLRERLSGHHDVELVGPGYTWEPGTGHRKLSEVTRGVPDWIVLDDCCAGYPPVIMDHRPKCKIAWREHDWHNRQRIQVAQRWDPDVILSCYERPKSRCFDPFLDHPGRRLVPHPVDTDTFHPGNGQFRQFTVGAFGREGSAYPSRTKGMRVVRSRAASKGDAWVPIHGGYWKDGRGCGKRTFYLEKLADMLRQVKCLFVAGGEFKGFVMKYLEGAACGCLLIGEEAYEHSKYMPDEFFISCSPSKVNEVADRYAEDEGARRAITEKAWEFIKENHSVPARAKQIIDILGES